MKFFRTPLLIIFLIGLSFFVISEKVNAQANVTGQCCVCSSLDNSEVVACFPEFNANQCANKSTSLGQGTMSITCAMSSCTPKKCQQTSVSESQKQAGVLEFKPNVPLPGFTQIKVDNSLLANYITALYKFFVGVAGILAVIMIAIGGLLWLFSGGESSKITKAKEIIIGAVVGLILVLTSYLILNTINPSLVNFGPLKQLETIKQATIAAEWCDQVELGEAYTYQLNNDKDPNYKPFKCSNSSKNCNEDALPTQTKCGAEYIIPGTNGLTCKGRGGCGTGQSCNVQMNEQGILGYQCIDAAYACNRLADDQLYQYGLFAQNQSSCDKVNVPAGSACIWVETGGFFEVVGGVGVFLTSTATAGLGNWLTGLAPWTSFNNDRCHYFDQAQIGALCKGGRVNACSDYNGTLGRMGGNLDVILAYAGYFFGNVDARNAVRKAYCQNDICQNARGESGVTLRCTWSSFGCQGDDRSDLTPATPGWVEGWTFVRGVDRQISDAAPDLLELLACLRTELNGIAIGREIGRISSISDSEHAGNLNVCRAVGRPGTCDHSLTSCHYGGSLNDNKSHAVDLGDEENGANIETAINRCSQFVGYWAYEPVVEGQPIHEPTERTNHIHISTRACRNAD